MRSARLDLTARAAVRDEALLLYALHGPEAVSLRQVAQAAGVSPGLVAHHFGSKAGLREAMDEHVARVLAEVADEPGRLAGGGAGAVAGFDELLWAHLPADSPVPAYLRRLLLSGDPAGRAVYRRWYTLSAALTEQLTAAGILRPSADPPVRAAFLMVNNLAMVLLREHLADVLGTDPLSPNGIRRWAADVVTAYTEGVFRQEDR